MDQRLSELIYHGREERNLENKTGMPWNADPDYRAEVAATAMAMANIRDGGVIVLGIGPDTYQPAPGSWDTSGYTHDIIARFVNGYASPEVSLTVTAVQDDERPLPNGNLPDFVVIEVQEFFEYPVVCRQSGQGKLKEGALLARGVAMHQTHEVSREAETREILDLAVTKEMRRRRAWLSDVQPPPDLPRPTDGEQFNRELEDFR